MNFDLSSLAAGFIFGVFGFYFMKWGKREAHAPSLFIGLILLVYPYFVENAWLVWGIGVALLALAFKLRS